MSILPTDIQILLTNYDIMTCFFKPVFFAQNILLAENIEYWQLLT